MPEWSIISRYGLVLVYLAMHPGSTVREISSVFHITEWTVHKIIRDLELSGYLVRQKHGRKNIYRVNLHSSLRHETLKDVTVGELLKLLGWRRRKKGNPVDT